MKINNETKIGALAIVGVVFLILGFNFLRGKSFFKKENHVYAVYEDIQGLTKSSPVVINGLQVGKVSNLDGGQNLKRIVVTVSLSHDVNIPNNSLAVINPNLLGSTSLEIKLGNNNTYLKNNDTLLTTLSGGAFDEALKMINPVLYEVRNATKSLDSVLHIIGGVFDEKAKNNIKGMLQNMNDITRAFTLTASSMNTLLDPRSGAFAKTLENANSFSSNLASNNQKVTDIMTSANKAAAGFASLDLQKTLNKLNSTVDSLQAGIAKINNNNGSLGLLLNDAKLYNNLASTSNKINILLDEVRVHPKRFLGFSVFGKKDKGNYLTAPLIDDTLKVIGAPVR